MRTNHKRQGCREKTLVVSSCKTVIFRPRSSSTIATKRGLLTFFSGRSPKPLPSLQRAPRQPAVARGLRRAHHEDLQRRAEEPGDEDPGDCRDHIRPEGPVDFLAATPAASAATATPTTAAGTASTAAAAARTRSVEPDDGGDERDGEGGGEEESRGRDKEE